MSEEPHDTDAERAVLGAILIAPDKSPDVMDAIDLLDVGSWHLPAHALAYASMLRLDEANEPIDEVTVKRDLDAHGKLADVGGAIWITQLSDSTPTAANVVHYAQIVAEMKLRRTVIQQADASKAAAIDGSKPTLEVIDDAAQALTELGVSRSKSDLVPASDLLKGEMIDIESRRKGGVVGLRTGFEDLDEVTGGQEKGDLVIIAARPSMGKTALALNVADNVATKADLGVAVFSLEMSKEQLIRRVLASNGRIDAGRMRSGQLKQTDWPKLANAAGRLSQSKLWIDDSSAATVREMMAKVRRLQMSQEVSAVVVAYMQLMRGNGGRSRENEISESSRGLKRIAKDLGVVVYALSQLNRDVEKRGDKRPMLSDLRESGAIEQDADEVWFVYRDDYYNEDSQEKGVAEIIVGKNRNGSTGKAKLRWFKEYTLFVSMDFNRAG